jgi:hypothetical protein
MDRGMLWPLCSLNSLAHQWHQSIPDPRPIPKRQWLSQKCLVVMAGLASHETVGQKCPGTSCLIPCEPTLSKWCVEDEIRCWFFSVIVKFKFGYFRHRPKDVHLSLFNLAIWMEIVSFCDAWMKPWLIRYSLIKTSHCNHEALFSRDSEISSVRTPQDGFP